MSPNAKVISIKTYTILLVLYFTGSSCSYYKFHVETSAATNQDCYTKIVFYCFNVHCDRATTIKVVDVILVLGQA